MGLFKTKTPEEQAAKQLERWLRTPPGQARLSRQRGDVVFQCAIDLAAHRGAIVPMVGGVITSSDSDPSLVLNQICAEGWELLDATVVFVPGVQESRDKFLASGQQVAISGTTVGYYVFRRRD